MNQLATLLTQLPSSAVPAGLQGQLQADAIQGGSIGGDLAGRLGVSGQTGTFQSVLSNIGAPVSPELLQFINSQAGQNVPAEISDLLQAAAGTAAPALLQNGQAPLLPGGNPFSQIPGATGQNNPVSPNTALIQNTVQDTNIGQSGLQNQQNAQQPAQNTTNPQLNIPQGDTQNIASQDATKAQAAQTANTVQNPQSDAVAKLNQAIDKIAGQLQSQVKQPQEKPGQDKAHNKLAEIAKQAITSRAAEDISTGTQLQYGAKGGNNINALQSPVAPANNVMLQGGNVGGVEAAAPQPTTDQPQMQLTVQGLEQKVGETAKPVQYTAQGQTTGHQSPAEQVSVKIANALQNGDSKISIQLEPVALGKVEVRIDMPHDGKAQVIVLAEKMETLDSLQKDARSLERALQDAGLKTGSDSLNFGLKQGQQFAGQQGNKAYQQANNIGDADNDNMMEVANPGQGEAKSYRIDKVVDIKV